MNNLTFILLIGLTSTISFSQTSSSLPQVSGAMNNGLISGDNRYNSIAAKGEISYEEAIGEYEMIGGSPFLHGGEITVDLITANDSILKSVTIQYDLYNQELVAKPKKGEFIVLDQIHYKGFIYNNKGVEENYLRIHPADLKFYQVLFQNEDFIFCKLDEITVLDDTRHVPGQEIKKAGFIVIQIIICIVERRSIRRF